MTEATQRTSDSGVSIWLDDLSRTRIESGNLQELIKDKNVVGVTTNPSLIAKEYFPIWSVLARQSANRSGPSGPRLTRARAPSREILSFS